MVNPLTVLRTIRHLSPRQVAYQLRHRLRGPAREPAQVALHGCTGIAIRSPWDPPSVEGEALDGGRGVVLFAGPRIDPIRDGWEPEERSPLVLYTLHYHGWINSPDADPKVVRSLILNWIDTHTKGIGWEPYPTAMRVLHWLGWVVRHRSLLAGNQERWFFGSLAAQLQHLEHHIEHHLDGNHLWTNVAALATAGLTLAGPLPVRLCDRWLPTLAEIIIDQLGDDGVHRERTPTYHCVLAEQISLVLEAMAQRKGQMPALLPTFRGALMRMSTTLPAFTHPDGDVALWGDSQRDAPVHPTDLARRLGVELADGDADAPAAGFYRRAWGPWTVLWNAGSTDLERQVGHIHADALAIELSLGEERVIVDAGVGTYTVGPDRTYSRSTAAHNTVTLGEDDRDQHELWASHRIGGRAQVTVSEASENILRGRVRGYQWPVSHRRSLEWRDGVLRCHDDLSAPGTPATLRYFIPATFTVVPIAGGFRVTTARGRRFTVTGPASMSWRRKDARGWSAIDREAPRILLSARLPVKGAAIELRAEN